MNLESQVIWKDIKGFKNLYKISNTGLIKSYKRSGSKGKILKPGNRRGYESVTLCKENIRKPCSVHRLVALNFIKKVKGKNYVNHKDGNKLNNKVSNLEWVTNKQNIEHSINKIGNTSIGEKNHNSKLKKREVNFIRYIKNKFPKIKSKDISNFYNVTTTCINELLRNKTWKE